MEQLISFLTHNFYFVIVVVGIFYSMFFRKSPIERKPNRMPDFGGSGHPRTSANPRQPHEPNQSSHPSQQPLQRPIQQRPQPQQRQEPNPLASRPAAKPDQSKREAPIRLAEAHVDPYAPELGPSAVAGTSQPKANAAAARTVETQRVGAAALSRSEIARAVMWAEILGPPRAKKPYRR
ncbi:hypothetical protein D7Z26_08360 [Cohnella endophytica]|uniref:Uncharacterized protein n=1 Tax=Cohnella endophytica TaxID=2419778 RepID=A0A494XXB0_9BACL|nr:hypothetical protein [Cohnella endophytica]RKP55217.1 hypothetical protein D7Z26_08360 [Cohnella endophytica]